MNIFEFFLYLRKYFILDNIILWQKTKILTTSDKQWKSLRNNVWECDSNNSDNQP